MNTKPKELTVGSLFSGIGGLDLGLERAGMRVIWQCEADPYCRAVLKHHWPDIQCFEDIRELCTQGGWWVEPPDLLCGGFPCQPISEAGKKRAEEDPRWLWPEFARVIGVLRPRYVLVENVPGLRKRGLGTVIGGLAALGYDAEWSPVSASALGAPHQRKRLFIIAHEVRHSDQARCQEPRYFHSRTIAAEGSWWLSEPEVCRVVDGVHDRLDGGGTGNREVALLGNAVVPQVAEAVGRIILAAHKPLPPEPCYHDCTACSDAGRCLDA